MSLKFEFAVFSWVFRSLSQRGYRLGHVLVSSIPVCYPRKGFVQVSSNFDSVGLMGKTLNDIATMLDVLTNKGESTS